MTVVMTHARTSLEKSRGTGVATFNRGVQMLFPLKVDYVIPVLSIIFKKNNQSINTPGSVWNAVCSVKSPVSLIYC